jgi:filamentous hemagglutinin family protein
MCILKFGIATAPSFLFCSIALTAQAQIIPDTTLPINSIVSPDANTSVITGGTQAGGNLLHSFEQFSIPTGTGAFFDNAIEIQNIFSRVTGNSISNIDGFIRANGTANLFLLNPNGIIFGPNASLDLGGSFVGSTADRLLFQDGTYYSATETQTVPLLTINVPIGLQFGGNPGGIVNRSQAFDSQTNTITGIQVTSGNTLALVGGNINVEGGVMRAIDGHLELGSVGANSRVNLTAQGNLFTLNYTEAQDFQDIQLSQDAQVFVSDFGRGGLQIQGRRIGLTDGSLMGVGNNSETLAGGNVTIIASEAIALNDSILASSTFQSGMGSSIVIETGRLSIENGAIVATSSESDGRSGNLTVRASESIAVSGRSPRNISSLAVGTIKDGDSGDLTIITPQLRVWDEGIVGGSNEGQGNGGEIDITTEQLQVWGGAAVGGTNYGTGRGSNLTLSASEFVEVRGTSGDGTAPSLLAVGTLSAGDAGNLTIDTGRLLILDGGVVGAETDSQGNGGIVTVRAKDVELSGNSPNFLSTLSVTTISSGNAGSISIETDRLRVFDGASVVAETTDRGRAGNITVRANLIELSGSVPSLLSSTGFSPSSLFAGTNIDSTGDAGSIAIDSQDFSIRDLAEVSVLNRGSGQPGSIQVNAENLRLDNQGSFNATSLTGRGGNINLQATNIQLRHQSEVFAAGSPNLPTSEGNIGINAETLVLLESSQILTSSTDPQGGSNIAISPLDSSDLVLLQSPDSRINARGELTITGEIKPEPANLPEVETTDVTELISNGCQDYQGSSFYVTGRGGIPPSPFDPLGGSAVVEVEWVELSDTPQASRRHSTAEIDRPESPLIEAQGWIVGKNGEIILTAAPYRGTPYSPAIPTANCFRSSHTHP